MGASVSVSSSSEKVSLEELAITVEARGYHELASWLVSTERHPDPLALMEELEDAKAAMQRRKAPDPSLEAKQQRMREELHHEIQRLDRRDNWHKRFEGKDDSDEEKHSQRRFSDDDARELVDAELGKLEATIKQLTTALRSTDKTVHSTKSAVIDVSKSATEVTTSTYQIQTDVADLNMANASLTDALVCLASDDKWDYPKLFLVVPRERPSKWTGWLSSWYKTRFTILFICPVAKRRMMYGKEDGLHFDQLNPRLAKKLKKFYGLGKFFKFSAELLLSTHIDDLLPTSISDDVRTEFSTFWSDQYAQEVAKLEINGDAALTYEAFRDLLDHQNFDVELLNTAYGGGGTVVEKDDKGALHRVAVGPWSQDSAFFKARRSDDKGDEEPKRSSKSSTTKRKMRMKEEESLGRYLVRRLKATTKALKEAQTLASSTGCRAMAALSAAETARTRAQEAHDEIVVAQAAVKSASENLHQNGNTLYRLVLKLANSEVGHPSLYMLFEDTQKKRWTTTRYKLFFICAATFDVIPYLNDDGVNEDCFTFDALTADAATTAESALKFWENFGPAIKFSANLLVDIASAAAGPLPVKFLAEKLQKNCPDLVTDLENLKAGHDVAKYYKTRICPDSVWDPDAVASDVRHLVGTKYVAFYRFLKDRGFKRSNLDMELKKIPVTSDKYREDYLYVKRQS